MQVKKGDLVKVHYTGKFESGEVFDSSYNRNEPLGFTVGSGQMIQGFDEAVMGMALGEEKTVTLPPEKAYGVSHPEYIFPVEKTQLPPDMPMELGIELMANIQGQDVPVTVIEITENTVKLDANHQMAGKTLVFDIKIDSIAH